LDPTTENAARVLGAELARAGFNLATFGWRGVDEIVARSFARGTGLTGADLEDRLVHFVEGHREARFHDGWQLRFSTEEDVKSGALGYADAIVAVGGGEWTFEFCRRAIQAGLLVLSLEAGGSELAYAARRLHEYNLDTGTYQRLGVSLASVEATRPSHPSAVPSVVKLLQEFFKQRPSVKPKPDRSSSRLSGLGPDKRSELGALLNDGPRLARFLSRSALAEPAFLTWLETLEAGQFLEAARVLGLASFNNLLELEAKLDAAYPAFQPNPLWTSWFQQYHAASLGEKLRAYLPRGDDFPPTA
jgi:hypothetical protein